MSLTLRNRNLTVNSSTFRGNEGDVAILLVSLHRQLRIHELSAQVFQIFLQGQEIRIAFLNMDMMNAMWVLCQVSYTLCMMGNCILYSNTGLQTGHDLSQICVDNILYWGFQWLS